MKKLILSILFLLIFPLVASANYVFNPFTQKLDRTVNNENLTVLTATATNICLGGVCRNSWPGGSGSSPLTTKGDIWVYGINDTRLPVGADGFFLSASSTSPTGLAWKTITNSSSQWTTVGNDIYYTTGKVSIGTTTLTRSLNVQGDGILFMGNNGYWSTEILDGGSADQGVIKLNRAGLTNTQITADVTQPTYFNAGSVGIGTTTPQALLHVVGVAGNLFQVTNSAGNSSLVIDNGTLTNKIWSAIDTNSGNNLVLKSSGTTVMTLQQTTGYVGIGTTTPTSMLQIADPNTADALRLQYTASTAGGNWAINPFILGISNGGLSFIDKLNGVTPFVISAITNNVGIGTTSASSKLTVNAASSDGIKLINSATGLISEQLQVGGSGNGSFFQYDGSQNIKTQLDAQGINFLNGGNVGIGITNPTFKFDVQGTSTGNWISRLNNLDPTAGYGLLVKAGNDSTNKIAEFRDVNDAARLTILGNGNLGIGTTTPAAQLHVSAPSSANGLMARFDSAYSGGGYISFFDTIAGATRALFGYGPTLFTIAGISDAGFRSPGGFAVGTNGGFVREYFDASGNIGMGGNITSTTTLAGSKMVISGNFVGIATNTPQSTLSVNGQALFYPTAESYDPGNGSGPALRMGYYSPGDYGYIYANNTGVISKNLILQGSNGKVGIGNFSPAYKLDVNGTTPADGIRSQMGFDMNPVLHPVFNSSNLSTTTGGSNLNIGTYIYTVTYLTSQGETDTSGGVGGSVVISATTSQVVIAVPTSTDARVTSRRIYRTPVNAVIYNNKVLATIADNVTSTYTDNTADGSLTGVTDYFRSNTTSNYLSLNGSRVFAVTPNLNANTFFGYSVGNSTLSSGRNVAFGSNLQTTLTGGASNVAVGNSAQASIQGGSSNIAIGYGTQNQLIDGAGNTAIGHDANFYNQNGAGNVALGYFSLFGGGANTYSYNTSIGYAAGQSVTSGNNNTYLGLSAGMNATSASSNIMIGAYAGKYETNSNTLIIDNLDRGAATTSQTSALVYGVSNSVAANNILSLGGGGKVGIGVSPAYTFDVNGTAYLRSTVIFGGTLTAGASNGLLNINNSNYNSNYNGGVGTLLTSGTNSAPGGPFAAVKIAPIYNQLTSSSSNTDLLINRTETNVGTGTQYLLDAQVGGVSKFNVRNTGLSTFGGSSQVVIDPNAGAIYSSNGLWNLNSGFNSKVLTQVNGTTIYRNIDDSNPVLIVNNAMSSSTGDLLQLSNASGTVVSFKKNGYVGIGMTTPGEKLDVLGDFAVESSLGVDSLLVSTTSQVVIGSTTPNGSQLYIQATSTYNPLSVVASTGKVALMVTPTSQIAIGTTTLDSQVSIWASSLYSEIFEVYNNVGSVMFKVSSGQIGMLTNVLSSAINMNGDINIQGINRYINFGTATGTTATSLGWLSGTSTIFSIYPAPVNMATATPIVVSDYEPTSFSFNPTAGVFSTYSDDINRMFSWLSTGAGTALVRNSFASGAGQHSQYVGASPQTATYANMLGDAGGVVRGVMTYSGYHFAFTSSSTGSSKIAIATSSYTNNVAANWTLATISGFSLAPATVGIVGAGNRQVWLASSTTVLVPFTFSTSTFTLTAGTPVTIAGANLTASSTRVNENGIYASFASAPFIRKYSFTGVQDLTYGNGISSVEPPSTGPSIFAMPFSIYSKSVNENGLHKVIGW